MSIALILAAASIGTLDIAADRVAVDNVTKAAVAEGNVTVREGVMSLRSEKLERDADGIVRLHRPSTATTCTNAVGHTHWCAEGEVEYSPHDYVVLRGVWLRLFEVPVFWLPYFWYPLDTDCGFSWMPGYTSRWGAYVMTKYRYHLLGDEAHGDESWWLSAATRLDLRYKNGVAVGEDFEWGLGRFGTGSFKAYYALDEDANRRYGGYGYYPSSAGYAYPYGGDYANWGGGSVGRDRYGFEAKHRWEATERDMVTLRGSLYSDAYFRNDFFRDSFFNIKNQFRSYDTSGVFWEHVENLFSFGAEADGRLETFRGATERLPEIYFDVNPTPVPLLPVNYESSSRIGYLRRRSADNTFSARPAYRSNPGVWADYESLRIDTYHRLTAPFRLFDVLSAVPRLAWRGTFYDKAGYSCLDGWSEAGSTGKWFSRSIVEEGITFAARGEAWVNDRWRHLVEPYFDVLAQQAHISGDSSGARAYVYDSLDASRTWEDQFAGRGRNLPYTYYGVTPGLRNAWSKMDEKGRLWTVLDFDAYAALQFNHADYLHAPWGLDDVWHRLAVNGKPNYGEGDPLVVPGARLRWTPAEDIRLVTRAEYDSDDNKVALADVTLNHRLSRDFDWRLSYMLRDHRMWDFSSSPFDPAYMRTDTLNRTFFHLAELGFTHQPLDWFRYSPFIRWDLDENELDVVGATFDFMTDCLCFRFYVEYENECWLVDGARYDEDWNFGFQLILRAFGEGGRSIFN